MRVAVLLPPDHPEHGGGTDGPATVAYNLGRIEDGVHNAPLGHDPVPLDDFVQGMVERAKADYPDAEVRVERLVDNGDGTSSWVPADEFDPETHTAQGPGEYTTAVISPTPSEETS